MNKQKKQIHKQTSEAHLANRERAVRVCGVVRVHRRQPLGVRRRLELVEREALEAVAKDGGEVQELHPPHEAHGEHEPCGGEPVREGGDQVRGGSHTAEQHEHGDDAGRAGLRLLKRARAERKDAEERADGHWGGNV